MEMMDLLVYLKRCFHANLVPKQANLFKQESDIAADF